MRKTIFYLLIFSLMILTLNAYESANAEPAQTKTIKPTVTTAASNAAAINQAVDNTIEQTKAQEQQLEKQVIDLQNKNKELQAEVKGLDKELMQAEVPPANPIEAIEKASPIIDMRLGIGLIFLAVLLLTWMFWPRRVADSGNVNIAPPKLREDPYIAESTSEDEYDFMNSEEAVPIKLDLARAYIDMEDFDAARGVLHEVLERGNAEQQQEAQELLSHLRV